MTLCFSYFFLFVLYISVHLYFMLPHKTEGGLAMYRSALVQNKHLSQLAKVNLRRVWTDSLKQALQVTYISDKLIPRAITILSSSSLIVVLIIACCWFILLMYSLNLSETRIVRLHAVLTRVCSSLGYQKLPASVIVARRPLTFFLNFK